MRKYKKVGNKKDRTSASTTESKIKFSKYANNLGYDEVIREKQEENAIWYKGNSDMLLSYYINARPEQAANKEAFRNSRDYFWSIVGEEPEVKCTHSGMPKTIINTLVNILGKPEITSQKFIAEDGRLVETDDVDSTSTIQKIIEDNEFYTILNQDQIPYTMVVGDGAYFINVDSEISDLPIIEFIDGRNVEFERKANRITSITARKYYVHNKKGYMLTDTRSTITKKDKEKKTTKRIATVEYHLYELTNEGSDEVRKEVELTDIPDTKDLESLEYDNIDCMLAVPCIFRYDKSIERGESFFGGKLDLFDDLDQSKSQASNCTRLSTPVDYLPEGLTDRDDLGNPIKPNRYDRRYMTIPSDRNATGQNVNQIQTTQPDIDFTQYNANQLEIVMDILSGLMSPSTLGIDLARKDNADAQREKEKVTLVTRDNLVDLETKILQKLFTVVLKVYDYIQDPKKKVGKYEITINYPEYANPSFESKLAYLVPALTGGGMSPDKYVEELWGDALSEEDKKLEIEKLEKRLNGYNEMQDTIDDFLSR